MLLQSPVKETKCEPELEEPNNNNKVGNVRNECAVTMGMRRQPEVVRTTAYSGRLLHESRHAVFTKPILRPHQDLIDFKFIDDLLDNYL